MPRHECAVFTFPAGQDAGIRAAPLLTRPILAASRVTAGAFEGLFRQYFLMCPFARRDRIFWIDTDIWPTACVDRNPTSCGQRLAFTGKQKMRVVHDAL